MLGIAAVLSKLGASSTELLRMLARLLGFGLMLGVTPSDLEPSRD